MKKIKVQPLTKEGFSHYGTYASMTEPSQPLTDKKLGFFPDMAILNIGNPSSTVSFSTCKVPECEPIIKTLEYHTYTGEGILPLDADAILYFSQSQFSFDDALDHLECFFVPCGTLLTILPGVWHYAPYTVNTDQVSVLIVLPTRTYKNDCVVKHIPEDQWMSFEM